MSCTHFSNRFLSAPQQATKSSRLFRSTTANSSPAEICIADGQCSPDGWRHKRERPLLPRVGDDRELPIFMWNSHRVLCLSVGPTVFPDFPLHFHRQTVNKRRRHARLHESCNVLGGGFRIAFTFDFHNDFVVDKRNDSEVSSQELPQSVFCPNAASD